MRDGHQHSRERAYPCPSGRGRRRGFQSKAFRATVRFVFPAWLMSVQNGGGWATFRRHELRSHFEFQVSGVGRVSVIIGHGCDLRGEDEMNLWVVKANLHGGVPMEMFTGREQLCRVVLQ